MAKNRLGYLFCLVISIGFYLVYSGWIAWFSLLFVIFLPVASLLLSLVPMMRSRVLIRHPVSVSLNEHAELMISQFSGRWLPAVPMQVKINIADEMAGTGTLRSELLGGAKTVALPLETAYVGTYTIEPVSVRAFDYLGLFSIHSTRPLAGSMTVLPVEVCPNPLPDFQILETCSYRPKPGGGFAEAHELRSYRPGDPIRDIHWKLSAKTDQLIVREPQLPVIGKRIVSFDFCGSREVLNSILGQLQWMFRRFHERNIAYELQWLEPATLEIQCVRIDGERQWNDCLSRLLRTTCSTAIPSIIDRPQAVNDWRYHIIAAKGEDDL